MSSDILQQAIDEICEEIIIAERMKKMMTVKEVVFHLTTKIAAHRHDITILESLQQEQADDE